MSRDGQEIGKMNGQVIERLTGPEKIRFTSSLLFRAHSTRKLFFLNNLVGEFEYEADESANTLARSWRCK